MHHRIFNLGIALVTAALAAPVLAQTYPVKPVELVIHTNPGGGQDTFSRLVAEVVTREKLLPQPHERVTFGLLNVKPRFSRPS